MNMKKPLYVKIGLFAVPTKKAAKSYMYFCLFVALVCFILGFVYEPRYFGGVIMLIAAFWYHSSIKWMDKNNAWQISL